VRPHWSADPEFRKGTDRAGYAGVADLGWCDRLAATKLQSRSGLFYVGTSQSFSVFYLTDTDPRPQGWGAVERRVGNTGNALKAIDYKTGKVRWSRPLAMTADGFAGEGAMGLLSTGGRLLFGNDGGGNFVAYEATTGRPLWHAGLATNTTNGPQTYMLDGKQYVVVGAGDTLFAFTLQ
jgi:alcohol dehydrogenase (cytochrome c)